jgi:hypothetical protein
MADNPNLQNARIEVDNKIYEFPIVNIPDYKGCGQNTNAIGSYTSCTTWTKSEFILSNEARAAIIAKTKSDVLSVKFVTKGGIVGDCGMSIYPREFALMDQAIKLRQSKK